RKAERADSDAIVDLLGRCFPTNPKAQRAVFDWQYWSNPVGDALSWMALEDGEVVGHYAGLPVPIVAGGAALTAAVGIDAATAPSHRGRGVFDQLLGAVYDDVEAQGWSAVLAFPNENSRRGCETVGGVVVTDFAVGAAVVDVGQLAHRFRIPTAIGSTVGRVTRRFRTAGAGREVTTVGPAVERLWESVTGRTELGLRRDPAWQRWRYEQAPQSYRFFEWGDDDHARAFCVTSSRTLGGLPALTVLDLVFATPADGATLLRHVRAQAAPAAVMVLAAPPADPVWAAAALARLRRLPDRRLPEHIHFGVARPRQPGLQRADWALPWGVLDHL
ncbi:MAG: hypothetical protein JWL70_1993, partial [Acidimicrobiia bacterium]|nr:hypothetical protein [Acidimicrobiia bacterium]